MLPDFRFALGGILALAVLVVAGVGLVSSVRLVREAQMAPLGESRSLAYAGHSEWNQFYDPDSARRFPGLAGHAESMPAETRIEARLAAPSTAAADIAPETSAPPAGAPPARAPQSMQSGPEERIASLPAPRPAPDAAPIMPERMPQTEAAPADPRPSTEPPATERAGAAARGVPSSLPASDASGGGGSGAPPAEQATTAPAASPGSDVAGDPKSETKTQTPAQPQATGEPPQLSAAPAAEAPPKPHPRRRTARARMHSIAQAGQQPWPNSPFPTTGTPWPSYDNQLNSPFTAAAGKKFTSKPATPANRPQ